MELAMKTEGVSLKYSIPMDVRKARKRQGFEAEGAQSGGIIK